MPPSPLTSSIIVPVYNTEKYLHRCIDSIISQTFSDWELILVDDGSTDNSPGICDEYAQKDSRIKVIHKKNGGVSSARNVGLDNATGRFITFVDADDIIANDYLEYVSPYLIENTYRAVTISAVRMSNDGELSAYTSYNDGEVPIDDFIKNLTHYVSWGYFFDNEIIKNNGLKYDESLAMSEDAVFILQYFQYIQSVYTMSVKKYYYRVNEASVTNNGMNYQKSLNHYRAAVQIHNLKGNGLLSVSTINQAVLYQLSMFFFDIRMIALNETDYSDLQNKIRELYKKTCKQERPEFMALASYSIKTYKLSYTHLMKARRKWRHIKKKIKNWL